MKKLRLFSAFLFLFITVANVAFADDFWNGHAQGWHWYHDPKWIKPHKDKNQKTIISSNNPITEMSIVQKTAKKALDNAILNPSQKNIQYYIEVQNLISENSSKFSQAWQQALVNNPHLNYSLSHPTNQVGKQLYLDLQSQDKTKAIHALSSQYGLFFFFRSTCPYCHRFAPIVKDFSERYGITVIPVSLDGGGLPEFPNPRTDNGASQDFKVTVVPALFLVNPETRKVIPVSYGLTTESDIENRLYQIEKEMKPKTLPTGYAS